jgi:hypothetical protein
MARKQVRDLQKAPGLQPVARPVDTYTTPAMTQIGRPDPNNQLLQLSEALGKVNPDLQRILERRQQAQMSQDIDMGKLLADRNKNLTQWQQLIDKGLVEPGMSPWVRRGWLEQAGRNASVTYEAFLKGEWIKNPDLLASDNPEDLQKFLAAKREEYVKSNPHANEADWANGFRPAAERAEQYLAINHTDYRQREIKSNWKQEFEVGLGAAVNQALKRGNSFDAVALTDSIVSLQQKKREEGMSWGDIHDMTRAQLLAAYQDSEDERILDIARALPLADGKTYGDSQVFKAALSDAYERIQSREERRKSRLERLDAEQEEKQINTYKNTLSDLVASLQGAGVADVIGEMEGTDTWREFKKLNWDQANGFRNALRSDLRADSDIVESPELVKELYTLSANGLLTEEHVLNVKDQLKSTTYAGFLQKAEDLTNVYRFLDDNEYRRAYGEIHQSLAAIKAEFERPPGPDVPGRNLSSRFFNDWALQYRRRVINGLQALGPDPEPAERVKVYDSALNRTLDDARNSLPKGDDSYRPLPYMEGLSAPAPEKAQPSRSNAVEVRPEGSAEVPPELTAVGEAKPEKDPLLFPTVGGIKEDGLREPADYHQYVQKKFNMRFDNTEAGWTRLALEVRKRSGDVDKLIKAIEAKYGGDKPFTYATDELDENGQWVMKTEMRWRNAYRPQNVAIPESPYGHISFEDTKDGIGNIRLSKLKSVYYTLKEMKRLTDENVQKYEADNLWAVYEQDKIAADPNTLKQGERLTPKMLLEDMSDEARQQFVSNQAWRQYPVVPNALWLKKLAGPMWDTPGAEPTDALKSIFEVLNITDAREQAAFLNSQKAQLNTQQE